MHNMSHCTHAAVMLKQKRWTRLGGLEGPMGKCRLCPSVLLFTVFAKAAAKNNNLR